MRRRESAVAAGWAQPAAEPAADEDAAAGKPPAGKMPRARSVGSNLQSGSSRQWCGVIPARADSMGVLFGFCRLIPHRGPFLGARAGAHGASAPPLGPGCPPGAAICAPRPACLPPVSRPGDG